MICRPTWTARESPDSLMYDIETGWVDLANAFRRSVLGMLPEKENDLGIGRERILIVDPVDSWCVCSDDCSGSSSIPPNRSASLSPSDESPALSRERSAASVESLGAFLPSAVSSTVVGIGPPRSLASSSSARTRARNVRRMDSAHQHGPGRKGKTEEWETHRPLSGRIDSLSQSCPDCRSNGGSRAFRGRT